MREAFETALAADVDPLSRWLDPRNTIAMLRADHELRGCTDLRIAALRRYGALAAVDARVQDLADDIARQLNAHFADPAASPPAPREIALAVRALIAAGPGSSARDRALSAGSDWLAARLPDASGPSLVTLLSPLVQAAAVRGRNVDDVVEHGRRLVDEVLHVDDNTWGRRRPELLGKSVSAGTVADAGRVLALLPGFGVDAARCRIVRQLLLGRLEERRDQGEDGPEVLVAMLFGAADLMSEPERAEVERQLRRWSPQHLVPDFATVHQLAWGLEPGRIGYTWLQRQLRRLAVLPDPTALADRAAFCLCLATNYAAWPGDTLHVVATGG
jgi:hypothetical protein